MKPTRKYVVTAGVDFSSGIIKSRATDSFNSKYLLGNIELSYVRKISGSQREKLFFFIGPQYTSFVQYVDWDNRESWTYLATHELGLKTAAIYQASSRRSFFSSLSVPVLQLLIRPPYNGFDLYIQEHADEIGKIIFRGNLSSFNKYAAVDWKTVYRYHASQHLDFLLSYLLRYQHVSGYNKVIHLQNQFTAGISVKF